MIQTKSIYEKQLFLRFQCDKFIYKKLYNNSSLKTASFYADATTLMLNQGRNRS
jgi:hypothetical protein